MKTLNLFGVLLFIGLSVAVDFSGTKFTFKAFNSSNYPVTTGVFWDQGRTSKTRCVRWNIIGGTYTDWIDSSNDSSGKPKNVLYSRYGGSCNAYSASYGAMDTTGKSYSTVDDFDGVSCRKYSISTGFDLYTTMSGSSELLKAVKLPSYSFILVKTGETTEAIPSGASSTSGCPEKQCGIKADLGFSCDSSGSITDTNFRNFKTGIVGLINQNFIIMGPENIRITLVKFDSRIQLMGSLMTTKSQAINAVNSMAKSPYTTNIAGGLTKLYEVIGKTLYNKIYVTFTDGQPNIRAYPSGCSYFPGDVYSAEIRCINNKALTDANTRNVIADFIAVGITSGVSRTTLLAIANDDSTRVITSSWSDFNTQIENKLKETCDEYGTVPQCASSCKGFCANGNCLCTPICEVGKCQTGSCISPQVGCQLKAVTCAIASSNCNKTVCNPKLGTNGECEELFACADGDNDLCNFYECKSNTCEKKRLYDETNICYDFKCQVINGVATKVVAHVQDCDPGNKCYNFGCVNDTGCTKKINDVCVNDPGLCKVARCDPDDRGCYVEDVKCTPPPCGGSASCDSTTGSCVYVQGPECPLPAYIDGINKCGIAYCDVSANTCAYQEIECADKCNNVICKSDLCTLSYCEDGKCITKDKPCEQPTNNKCEEAICDKNEGCIRRKKAGIIETLCDKCDPYTGKVEPVLCTSDSTRCKNGYCNYTDGICYYNVESYCEGKPCHTTLCKDGICDYEYNCNLPLPEVSCYDIGCVEGRCDYVLKGCGHLDKKRCSSYVCNHETHACEEQFNTQCAVNNDECITYKCSEETGECVVDTNKTCERRNCHTVFCHPNAGCIYEKIDCGFVEKDGYEQTCQPLVCDEINDQCVTNVSLFNASEVDACGYCKDLGLPCFEQGIGALTYGAPILAGAIILAVIVALVVAVLVFATSTKVYGLITRASGTMTGNVQSSSIYEATETEFTNPQFS